MSKALFDRLAKHAATFEDIAKRNRAHHYEDVQARGMEAQMLAIDITKAMSAVQELNELRELAADPAISCELIGIRVRNGTRYT